MSSSPYQDARVMIEAFGAVGKEANINSPTSGISETNFIKI